MLSDRRVRRDDFTRNRDARGRNAAEIRPRDAFVRRWRLTPIDPALDIRLDVRLRNLEQYEREIVSKPVSNWGKFAICYRNSR